MTDREKLIEILERAGSMRQFSGSLANILIENGVVLPVRCKDCTKEWCYLRQQMGANGYCAAGTTAYEEIEFDYAAEDV